MDNYTFIEFKKRAIESIKVHEKLIDGTFWLDKNLINELFDDSPLEEDKVIKSKIRIGDNYQAIIPNKIKD